MRTLKTQPRHSGARGFPYSPPNITPLAAVARLNLPAPKECPLSCSTKGINPSDLLNSASHSSMEQYGEK